MPERPPQAALPARIFLAGMMGSGKSSVGRLLAERLGRPFVDLDPVIEQDAGKRIAEIFAEEGEPAFRQREREAVSRILAGAPAVVALGGGTVVDPEIRERLARSGALVCLTASPAALAARLRLDRPGTRPLLEAGPVPPESEVLERISRLLRRRQPAYDAIGLQLSVERLSVAQAVEAVLALLQSPAGRLDAGARSLPVRRPSRFDGPRFGYSALVGPGLLDGLGHQLRARGLDARVLLVSDRQVAPLHAERALASLAAAGLDARLATLGLGEPAKSLRTLDLLYAACLDFDLDRDGIVLALGGGVVGDTAGLLAATWLRGLRFVQAPTSLLAMVDAALGGKVGVNLAAGKNLVGAFHHPELVLADTRTLASLPERELRGGMAEVVKAALIADPGLLARLEREALPAAGDAPGWTTIVARAMAVKAELVGEDPVERGRRVLLNLGHTFAHAIEQVSAYGYSHGEAVAVGLVAAARLSARMALLEEAGLVTRIERVLEQLGLPTRCAGLDADALLEAMAVDKKRRSGRLRFVLPHAAGEVRLHEGVRLSALRSVLRECCAGDARAGDPLRSGSPFVR